MKIMNKKIYWWRIPMSKHNGLVSRAAPGTHEAVAVHVSSLPIDSTTSNLLDLAAGSGALLSRLSTNNYKTITAVELNVDGFGLDHVVPKAYDLNKNFSENFDEKYDLITAVEIIEHLDSPRHFLNEIFKLLKPGGYSVISTPNVVHWLSRLQFLFKGELKYFTRADFEDQRHISPILDMHMRIICEELGYEIVTSETTASSWGVVIRMLVFPISFLFRIFTSGGDVDGNVNIYVLRKPDS